MNGKTYDGGTTATISSNGSLTRGGTTSGDGEYIGSDVVAIAPGGSATFNSANVGLRTATGSLTLQGTDDANYTLTAPTAAATISAEAITIAANDQSPTYGFGGSSAALGTTEFRPTSGIIYGSDITGVTLSTNATRLDLEQLQRRHLDHHALGCQRHGRHQLRHHLPAQLRHPRHRAKGADRQRLCGEWQDL